MNALEININNFIFEMQKMELHYISQVEMTNDYWFSSVLDILDFSSVPRVMCETNA